MKIPIEISARHIHLCEKDLEKLFGTHYQLKKLRNLSYPNNFAAKETLVLQNRENAIKGVRIIGPLRHQTQVEVSFTDTIFLGRTAPIRKSGSLQNSAGIILIGPKGKIKLKQGLIIPWRHIHFNEIKARKLRLKENDLVSVRIKGKRGLIFNNVLVRVYDGFKTFMHLDTDEGNACGIVKKAQGELI